MDAAQWPQEIVVKPIEEIVTKAAGTAAVTGGGGAAAAGVGFVEQRKATTATTRTRPQKEQALNCPRCNSANTKFCYYNNYSLTQPRYFCKTCRRYWTEGGSLRNIPVGGGSRKNKRSSQSSNSSNPSSTSISCKKPSQDLSAQNPSKLLHEGQDLNLAFPRTFSDLMQLPCANTTNEKNQTAPHQLSAMELLTGISSRGLNSFPMPVQDPNNMVVYSSGFPLHHQDFKPSLNFSLDGMNGSSAATGFGSSAALHGGVQENNNSSNGIIRPLFPFEDLKHVPVSVSSTTTTDHIEPDREHGGDHSAGYWTGMLGGGSW